MTSHWSTRRILLGACVAACLFVGFGLTFAGPAAAGDNISFLEFQPDELDVEPSETVELDIVIESHGRYGQTGLEWVSVQVDYPSAYVDVTDVAFRDWFETAPDDEELGGGDTDVEVTESIERDQGQIVLEQGLVDPDIGVMGEARFATLTVEVAEDAEPATVQLFTNESEVLLADGYGQRVSHSIADLHVAGGGETIDPWDANAQGQAQSGSDWIPAPTGAVVVAVILATLLAARIGAGDR